MMKKKHPQRLPRKPEDKKKFVIRLAIFILFSALFLFSFLYIDNQKHKIEHSQISKTLLPIQSELNNNSIAFENKPLLNKYHFVLNPDYIKEINFYEGSILSKSVLFLIGLNRAAGLTIGDSIFILNEKYAKNPSLLAHELVHTAQYREEGRIKFIIKYMLYFSKKGYTDIPYEIEARKFAEEAFYLE